MTASVEARFRKFVLSCLSGRSARDVIVSDYTLLGSSLVGPDLRMTARGRIGEVEATQLPLRLHARHSILPPSRLRFNMADGVRIMGGPLVATLKASTGYDWSGKEFEVDFIINFASLWQWNHASWCLSVPQSFPQPLSRHHLPKWDETRLTIGDSDGSVLRPIGGIAARLDSGDWTPAQEQLHVCLMVQAPGLWNPHPETIRGIAITPQSFRELGAHRVEEGCRSIEAALSYFEEKLHLKFPGRLVIGVKSDFRGASSYPPGGVIGSMRRPTAVVSPEVSAALVFRQFLGVAVTLHGRNQRIVETALSYCAALHYLKRADPRSLAILSERLASGPELPGWRLRFFRSQSEAQVTRARAALLGLHLFHAGNSEGGFFDAIAEFLRENWGTAQQTSTLEDFLRARGTRFPQA